MHVIIIGNLEARLITVQTYLTAINRDLKSITARQRPCFVADYGKDFTPHACVNILFTCDFNFNDSKPIEFYRASHSDIQ